MKLPFEQIEDVRPFIRHFFFTSTSATFSQRDGPENGQYDIDESEFTTAEVKISSLSHTDLIHYLKSVASFIRKRNHEDLVHIIPLFSLLYRVCIKVSTL